MQTPRRACPRSKSSAGSSIVSLAYGLLLHVLLFFVENDPMLMLPQMKCDPGRLIMSQDLPGRADAARIFGQQECPLLVTHITWLLVQLTGTWCVVAFSWHRNEEITAVPVEKQGKTPVVGWYDHFGSNAYRHPSFSMSTAAPFSRPHDIYMSICTKIGNV